MHADINMTCRCCKFNPHLRYEISIVLYLAGVSCYSVNEAEKMRVHTLYLLCEPDYMGCA